MSASVISKKQNKTIKIYDTSFTGPEIWPKANSRNKKDPSAHLTHDKLAPV